MTIYIRDTVTFSRESDLKVGDEKQTCFEYRTENGFGFLSTKIFNIGDTVTLSSKDFHCRLGE